jgi:hypothetical protein
VFRMATLAGITIKYGVEVNYDLPCLLWTDCTCDQINYFPGLIYDVSQLQVWDGWEHRRLLVWCMTGGWNNNKWKHDRRL